LLSLTEADDAARGSGRYGDRWRLPLGHQARAAIAERLAVLGDPRRGVGLINGLPDIDWCLIDGGEVTIEGQRHVVEPFRMARYPITIAQFRAFVDDCFRDGEWHLPLGFQGELPHKGPPSHPASRDSYGANRVSWRDTSAYCHWLASRLKAEIRLPTEAQWQLAATGGDPERIYPWGRDWDPQREPWRANTDESGLGRMLPVGFYPLGAAPGGLMDMAGNLEEWCQDEYARQPSSERPWYRRLFMRKEPPAFALRVLRGGSWNLDRNLARSAHRLTFNPSSRHNFVGFRVVCSSPCRLKV
jgi:formylglycine-generating enzyme required for sulfatase activity